MSRHFRQVVDELGREAVAEAMGVSVYVVRDLYYGDVPIKADELHGLTEIYPDFDVASTVQVLTVLRRERGLVKPRRRRG